LQKDFEKNFQKILQNVKRKKAIHAYLMKI
jgi:hypothetical protein